MAKLSIVFHACNTSIRMQTQEDHEFKISLNDIEKQCLKGKKKKKEQSERVYAPCLHSRALNVKQITFAATYKPV
jgi:hypothetical protein